MSLDVTGWSPNADKKVFLAHHDLQMTYFNGPGKASFSDLWEGLKGCIRKSGNNITIELSDGMVQGWTGRLDCGKHAKVILYCMYELKGKNIIGKETGVIFMVQIADAVVAFLFSKDQSKTEHAHLIGVLANEITNTYSRLGLEVATEKTIISTNSFHFLNRLYAEGSEVLLPFRTLMKISQDPFRTVVSFNTDVEEATSSARGAIAKGACSVLAYVMYVRSAISSALRYCMKVVTEKALVLSICMFAPCCIGGWGMSAYCDMMTKEKTENYRSMNNLIHRIVTVDFESGEKQRSAVDSLLEVICFPEYREPSVWGFMSAPRSVCNEGVTDLSGLMRRLIMKGSSALTQMRPYALR